MLDAKAMAGYAESVEMVARSEAPSRSFATCVMAVVTLGFLLL